MPGGANGEGKANKASMKWTNIIASGFYLVPKDAIKRALVRLFGLEIATLVFTFIHVDMKIALESMNSPPPTPRDDQQPPGKPTRLTRAMPVGNNQAGGGRAKRNLGMEFAQVPTLPEQ